jgi:peptidoglycan/LPS O-acetylase OafA/YrhL
VKLLSALNALRFVAIVMIYFQHLQYPHGLGSAGVVFFFMLSGFVMAYKYNQRFVRLNAIDVKHFLWKRFAGIFPLHLLTFVLSIPLMYLGSVRTNIGYALLNILLLHSLFPIGIQVFSFNSLSWFISDLALFYCLTPYLLYVLNKYQVSRKPKYLLSLIGVCLVCETIVSWLCIDRMQESFSLAWWFAYISPYNRIFVFLIGVSIGLLYCTVEKMIDFKNIWIRTVLSIFEGSTLLFMFAALYYRFVFYPVLSFISTMIIMVFSLQKGMFSVIIGNRMLVYLGSLSLSIYLIHQLVINYTAYYFTSEVYGMVFEPIHFIPQVILLFVIVCMADVIDRHFKEPLRNWIVKKAVSR